MSDFDLSSMLPTSFGTKKKAANETAPSAERRPADVSSAENEFLRSMLPAGFGKSVTKSSAPVQFDKTKRVETDDMPCVPAKRANATQQPKSVESGRAGETAEKDGRSGGDDGDDDDDEDADENEDSVDDYQALPTTHEIRLTEHQKTVSALALDPAGARLITGSYDYTVKLWDFAGMETGLRPFRSIQPFESHQIHDIQYSTTGDRFLVIAGCVRPKLYDRDGDELAEYAKGDPYIRDARHTDGHTAALTSCSWNPMDRDVFATAGGDSTIRLWNVENVRKQKQVIVVRSKDRGGKTSVTSTSFSTDGKYIASACQDGSFSLWASKGPFIRPTHTILQAHTPSTDISGVRFSTLDPNSVITRCADDSMKLWDIRNFKNPVASNSELPSLFPGTNAAYSPDERFVITGTAAKKGVDWGQIAVCDSKTLEILGRVNVTKASVIRVLWHSRLNQIVAGCADSTAFVLYSPNVSVRGAKLCAVRKDKVRPVDAMEFTGPIITPHALPMFREDKPRSKQRRIEKIRKDPKASRRPELPLTGAGRGGRVGSSANEALIRGLTKNTMRDEDPREALLKYADEAAKNPYWVAPAYQKTQPKAVFDEVERPEDHYEMPRRGDLKAAKLREPETDGK